MSAIGQSVSNHRDRYSGACCRISTKRLNKAVRVIFAAPALEPFGQSRADYICGSPLDELSSSPECVGVRDVGNFTVLHANDVFDQREVQRAKKLSNHEHRSRECLGPRQSRTPPSRA